MQISSVLVSEFLKTHALNRTFPFLPDLARMEWEISRAFHSRESQTFDASRLVGLQPEELEKIKFRFQPSVRLINSAWPVLDLWNARHSPVQDINIDLQNNPQNILIRREGFKVLCDSLDDPAYAFLNLLVKGTPLGQACEILAEKSAEPLPVRDWFAQWTALGLVSDFELPAVS